jgi:hypothetical protein
MSGFPNLSNIEGVISNSIKSKANASLANSGKLPWFRLITLNGYNSRGLIIDPINVTESFSTRYGSNNIAGIVGYDRFSKPVYSGKTMMIDVEERDKQGNITTRKELTTEGGVSFETRGLRPSPTIDNIKIENGTEGLTRKVSFTIKCYTLSQAELVSQHYLEPGAYVLLEYGWNIKKSLEQRCSGTGKNGEITPCDLVYYSNLAVLKDKRKLSEGTYDAILAKVTGGGISFGDDESFNVEVKLTSQGELPAYLRSQTGKLVLEAQATSGVKFTQQEMDEAEDEYGLYGGSRIGEFLFMQMYNELPTHKQIGDIKNLINTGTDSTGNPWSDPANFVNMDTEVREDLVKSVKDKELYSKNADSILKVPEDIPLVSQERYIRFELAFKILQTVSRGPKFDTGCNEYPLSDGSKVNPERIKSINIDNTICRAHKHMFSIDKSKLFIPNTNLPDFQLTSYLSNKEIATGSLVDPFIQHQQSGEIKTINAHPKTEYDISSDSGQAWKNFGKRAISFGAWGDEVTSEVTDNSPEKYAFPSTVDGPINKYKFDDTIIPSEPKAYEYGYLKNLYINFNFFMEVLNAPGLFEHECLMEMMNGMSAATNLYWDFQIIEKQNFRTGDSNLEVYDRTYLGFTERGLKRNDDGIPDFVTTKFQSRGISSPFLDASLDMSIPGDMMGQIMMQKTEAPSDGENTDSNSAGYVSSESKKQNLKTGLFSPLPDPVALKLHTIASGSQEIEDRINNARIEAQKQYDEDNDFGSRVVRPLVGVGVQMTIGQKGLKFAKDSAIAAKEFTVSTAKSIGSSISSFSSTVASGAKKIFTGDSEQETEFRKQNFKYFIERAAVLPKINDRNQDYDITNGALDYNTANDATTEDVLFVGVWEDKFLLKKYELYDSLKKEGDTIKEPEETTNPVLLPIKFNFTIHGTSGLKVGDCFKVIDLPKRYSDKVFQIIHIEHEVGDLWKTAVEAQIRNV